MTSTAFHRAINTHGNAAAFIWRGGGKRRNRVESKKGEITATDKNRI